MSALVFVQRSRLGRKLFVLEDMHLKVNGHHAGRKFEAIFLLSEISPNYERICGRYHVLVLLPLILAMFLAAGTRMMLTQIVSDRMVVFIPVGLAIIFLLVRAVKGIPPVEIVRFRNRQGVALFDVVKERDQERDFEQFIADIVLRLEKMTSPLRS